MAKQKEGGKGGFCKITIEAVMGPAFGTFEDLTDDDCCTWSQLRQQFERLGHERLNVSQPVAHRSEHNHANPKRREISFVWNLLVGS